MRASRMVRLTVGNAAQCNMHVMSGHGCGMHAGFPASKLFGQGVSYTYDDVIFLPGHINFAAHEVRSSCVWRDRA